MSITSTDKLQEISDSGSLVFPSLATYRHAARHLLPHLPEKGWLSIATPLKANGRLDKRPTHGCKSSDPRSWDTLEQVHQRLGTGATFRDGSVANITAVAFAIVDGIVTLDIDDCVDSDGVVNAWTQLILKAFSSFAYRTVSGTGIRICLLQDPDFPMKPGKFQGTAPDGTGVEIFTGPTNFYNTFSPDPLPGYDIPLIAKGEFLNQLRSVILTPLKEESDGDPRSGENPEAAIEDIVAALAEISNTDRSWERFNNIGMTVYRASDGSEDGREAWRTWSQKCGAHRDDEVDARWEHYWHSPPSSVGFGTLVFEARKANPEFVPPSRRVVAATEEFEVIEAANAATELAEAAAEDSGEDFDDVPDEAPRTFWDELLRGKPKKEGEKGPVLLNNENAARILKHAPVWLAKNLRYNMFADIIEIEGRALDEEDGLAFARWCQCTHLEFSEAIAFRALVNVGKENAYHPVRDYLKSLKHDSVNRINTWLMDYAGVEDTQLHRAYSAKFLIGMVARAMKPGSKVDTMLILEGPQGIRKSTLLRALCPDPRWYLDDLGNVGEKDTLMRLQGHWLVEAAELHALGKAETNHLKAFLAQSEDVYRPSYGRVTVTRPRQYVFSGTVNPDSGGYLKDATGARRYWPVTVGEGKPDDWKIDIAGLEAVRDQLFAEALVYYQRGETWWLDTADLERQQAASTSDRYEGDPWTEAVEIYLDGRNEVTTAEVLTRCLLLHNDQMTRAAEMRVAKILRVLKWTRRKTKRGYVFNPPGGSDQNGDAREAVGGTIIPFTKKRPRPTDREDFEALVNG